MKFTDPYVNIPGAKVQHLVSYRDPWRWVTILGERRSIPRTACFHGGYSRNRDDAERTDTPDPRRPLCKTCRDQWEWEAFLLQRRSLSMSEVIFGMA